MRLDNRSGFTLVEMLIGLAMWMLVAVALSSVVRGSAKLWKEMDQWLPVEEEARAVFREFSREFRNSVDMADIPSSGDATQITFVMSDGQNRLWRVTYARNARQEIERRRERLGSGPRLAPQSERLGASPIGLSFEFAGEPTDGALQWTSVWKAQESGSRPLAIRTRLTLSDAAGHVRQFERTVFR